MSGFNLCADFTLFPDNHQLGPNFTLSSFGFSQAGGMLMFVNATANELGLQFPDEGVEISLPVVTDLVTLRIGTFASSVKIEAVDLTGNSVAQQVVPSLNRYVDIKLNAPEIAKLIFNGGNNEVIMPRICVTICCS